MFKRILYQHQPPWPGIFAPHSTCELCTWAWLGGRHQIKFVNLACREHARFLGGAS